MPKFQYALERGGEKSLEVAYGGSWKNLEVRFNGNLIGKIPNRKELKRGQVFQLPDRTTLTVQLVNDWLGNELHLLRNGKPVPGSSSDPSVKITLSAGFIYFYVGMNILLGLVAIFFQVEYLQALRFGGISIAIGLLFLVLGIFTQRHSLIALIIAILLVCLDILLIFFSGFITAFDLFGVYSASNMIILRMIAQIIQYMALPFGLLASTVYGLIVMGRSVGAINELKNQRPAMV